MKTMDWVFIGYALNRSAYRFLVYKSKIPDINANMIIESRDIMFSKTSFCLNGKKIRLLGKEHMEQHLGMKDPLRPTSNAEVEPRRSQRSRISKSFSPDFVAYALESKPQTFKEAISTPEAQIWKETVTSEIEFILSNHVWELANLPPGSKPIGSKWFFKRKLKLDGSSINTRLG